MVKIDEYTEDAQCLGYENNIISDNNGGFTTSFNGKCKLLEIGNQTGEHIYIKSDGSLNDSMEIVSYPISLNYHKSFSWKELIRKSVILDYCSHQTITCGLHIHVSRNRLGETKAAYDRVITLFKAWLVL